MVPYSNKADIYKNTKYRQTSKSQLKSLIPSNYWAFNVTVKNSLQIKRNFELELIDDLDGLIKTSFPIDLIPDYSVEDVSSQTNPFS